MVAWSYSRPPSTGELVFKISKSKISEVPLRRGRAHYLLQWVIALLTFVVSLAVVTALVLAGRTASWRDQVRGAVTVQILPLADGQDSINMARLLNEVTDLLVAEPSVQTVEPLDAEHIDSLLQPWISGDLLRDADLPIPQIIHVAVHPGLTLDTVALTEKLRQISPNIVVTDNAAWLVDLVDFTVALQAVAWLVGLLVAGACLLSVVLVTRSGVVVHRETIELLHLIGARDSYIARQFQSEAFRMGLRGSLLGMALFLAAFALLSWSSASINVVLIQRLAFEPSWILALAPLPYVLAMASAFSARWTVISSLRELP